MCACRNFITYVFVTTSSHQWFLTKNLSVAINLSLRKLVRKLLELNRNTKTDLAEYRLVVVLYCNSRDINLRSELAHESQQCVLFVFALKDRLCDVILMAHNLRMNTEVL